MSIIHIYKKSTKFHGPAFADLDKNEIYLGNYKKYKLTPLQWAKGIVHEELHIILKKQFGYKTSLNLDNISEPLIINNNNTVYNYKTAGNIIGYKKVKNINKQYKK